ncbi:MAG: DNA cytosine methyltransferase [Mariprofundaceae bacterium]|nr:DNA cytosine methyltransferase [Mariprofundaceae bacterium]
MKSVELFAGIGGFRIACDELDIQTIWANDIEPKASQVYTSQFGCKEHVEGNIDDYLDSIPEHDLLTGGFPCQPFSSAGKKLGINDSRGSLFEKITYIINKKKPKYFILENVKRLLSMEKGAHFARILKSLSDLGYLVEWRLLNAVHFGLPQNRERIVIIGHRNSPFNAYLCSNADFNTLSCKTNSSISHVTQWKKIKHHRSKFLNWGMAFQGRFCHADVLSFSEKQADTRLHSILEATPDSRFFFTKDTLKRIQNSDVVNKFYNGVEILYNQKGGARMGYSIFGTAGVAPTLTCTTSRHYERYRIHNEYRRLTNIEYARIQGFPDLHCQSVSIYDQYPLYGNAVPPALVKWVIDRIINKKHVPLNNISKKKELF